MGAILFEQNSEWTVQRAYSIPLESIAPIGEDPLVSLPTLATRVSWPKPVIVGLSASYTTQRDMTGTRVRGLQSRCGAMRPHRPPGLDLNNRNQVERLWVKLKEWCALATRYKKIAVSFLGALSLAMVVD